VIVVYFNTGEIHMKDESQNIKAIEKIIDQLNIKKNFVGRTGLQNNIQIEQHFEQLSKAFCTDSALKDENKKSDLAKNQNTTNEKNLNLVGNLSEKYRLIALNTSDLIAFTTFDVNPVFTFVSPSHKRILGYEEKDLLGRSGLDFIHNEDKELLLTVLLAYIEAKINNSLTSDMLKNTPQLDFRFLDKSGQWHYFRSTVDIVNDELLFISKDISEQKKTEEQLRHSNELFSKAFRSSPIAITITRISDGKFLEVNKTLEKLIGYSRGELLSQTTLSLGIWFDINDRKNLFEELAKTGSLCDHEYRFRSKDGSIVITRYSGEVVDFNGEQCVLSVLVDITDYKKADELLRESEEKYRTIVENTLDVIMLTDSKGRISYISPASSDVLGYLPDELIGKIPEIFYPDDLEKVHNALSSALLGSNGSNFEYRILTKDGKIRWVSHSWSPLFTKEHNVKCIVSVVRNITGSKIFEQSLKEKIEELERYKTVTVNREVKMVELKNEINELNKQLNQKPKYPPV
jgi:PAS domain S-box-containing protein